VPTHNYRKTGILDISSLDGTAKKAFYLSHIQLQLYSYKKTLELFSLAGKLGAEGRDLMVVLVRMFRSQLGGRMR
jgi:hypothetical protein